MNLPNKLTLLRIVLIPVFILFATRNGLPGAYMLAGAVFTVASFTDYLDGHIARKRGLVTDFGKFADPLADKILTTTAFLYMMADGVCDPLVLVVVLAREFAVSGVRMMAARAKESKVIAAGFLGKLKTVLQMVTIIFYYIAVGLQHSGLPGMDGYWPQMATWVLCWLVAILTAASGLQYIWGSRKYIDTTS